MNWYRVIKIAAYEEWQDKIEQLSRQNPYPFTSWFDENGRSYIPFETGNPEDTYEQDDKYTIELLQEKGCTDIDYRNGYCTFKGNKYRIGKLLEYFRKEDLQELQRKGEAGEIYNIQRDVEETNRFYNEQLNQFVNSPLRTNKGSEAFMVVISQNPHDVASMSTDRNWTSCMQLGVGSHHQDVFCEVSSGGLVAYLIHGHDVEIQNPLARIHIRRFENKEGISIAISEDSVYGNQMPGFEEVVNQWLQGKQGNLEPGMYTRMGGEYSDSFEDQTLVSPSTEEGVISWLDGTDPNAIHMTYTVRDGLATEWNVEVGQGHTLSGEEMDDYTKTFTDKKEAEEYFASISQYLEPEEEYAREQFEEGDFDFGDILWNAKDPETGEYVEPRFKFRINKKDLRNEMQNYAMNQVLNSDKETYLPEVIQMVHDRIFDAGNMRTYNFINDKTKRFIEKFPEYVTEEDLEQIKGHRSVISAYKSLTPDQQERLKPYFLEQVNSILDDPELLVDDEHRRRNSGRLGIDVVLPSKLHDKVLAPLTEIYLDTEEAIPEPIIQKLVNFAFNVKQIAGRDIMKEQEQYLWGDIAHTFMMTDSDTPTVQNFYKALLPYWGENHRYYGDEKYQGGINVSSFGYRLAKLGDNGRDFLPFLQEKLMSERNNLEEAKKRVIEDPEGGPKHPIHLKWSTLVIRLEKNIETYLYIIDSIESGNKRSSKYKFHS